MMSNLIRRKQIPNLTPFRFILVLLVIIYHVPQFCENRGFPFYSDLAIFHKGVESVYVFFSLSGFLIIKQLFDEKRSTDTINLKSFYIKRILRIFPLYYLVLIFGFLYYHFILPHFGFDFENNYDIFSGILLSVTFFSNIFQTYSPGGILEVLWSIGIEEQFYLFIAPLFYILTYKRIKLFLGIFSILYFSIYFSEYVVFLKKYNMLFFYFSFSGLLSIYLNKKKFRYFIKSIRYIIFLIFIIYFSTTIFKDYFNLAFYNFFSMILFGLTISALSQSPIKIIENKGMNYLGKISYGMYMYHTIVIQLVGLIYLKIISKLGLNSLLNIIIFYFLTLLLTIIISHFSFKYYENYFLKLKPKRGLKKEVSKH